MEEQQKTAKDQELKEDHEENDAIELVLFQVSECYVYLVSKLARPISQKSKFLVLMQKSKLSCGLLLRLLECEVVVSTIVDYILFEIADIVFGLFCAFVLSIGSLCEGFFLCLRTMPTSVKSCN